MNKLTHRFAAGALALAVFLCLPGVKTADAAGYLKLGDIKGEATDDGHKDWILIESMSSPMASSSSGLPTGKRQHKPFTMTKPVDKASPLLQEAVATGKVFPTVIIDYTEADARGERATYLRYELKNVMITSFSPSGGTAGGDRPMETFSLNYEEVKMTPQVEEKKSKRKPFKREKDKDR